MLAGDLNHSGTYNTFMKHPVWKEVLQWLQHEVAGKADGEYPIQGKELYAIISRVETKPRPECVYESHQNYIDVHYCIEGSELIEWTPTPELNSKTEYNAESDYTLYEAPKRGTIIKMTPGIFSIFFPDDAHMPKITTEIHNYTRKVVIKIRTNALK
jgi:biofilm protein TabA